MKTIKRIGIFIVVAAAILAILVNVLNHPDNAGTDNNTITDWGFEDIGVLNTAEFYFTTVEQHEGSPAKLFGVQVPFVKSHFLYQIDGYVKAGLNFGEIKVKVLDAEYKVIVTLPEITITDSKLDNKSIKVFDESKNIFRQISVTEVTASLDEVEEEAKENAIEKGLLKNAEDNAKSLITGMITRVLPEYEVEFS